MSYVCKSLCPSNLMWTVLRKNKNNSFVMFKIFIMSSYFIILLANREFAWHIWFLKTLLLSVHLNFCFPTLQSPFHLPCLSNSLLLCGGLPGISTEHSIIWYRYNKSRQNHSLSRLDKAMQQEQQDLISRGKS